MSRMGEGLRVISINKKNLTYMTSDGVERGFLFGVDEIENLTVEKMNDDLEHWLKVFSDLGDERGE